MCLVADLSVDPQEQIKVMQIRILAVFVRVRMMPIRVLVLPQNRVANEKHGPDAPFVDPGCSTGGKVTGIVSQGPHQPTGNGKEEGSQDACL